MENTVCDFDVCRVGFDGNAVVSVCNVPAVEGYVVCVDGIRTICVADCTAGSASIVDEDVLEEDVAAVDYGHCPLND